MKISTDFDFNKSSLSDGFIFVSKIIREDFPVKEVYEKLDNIINMVKEDILKIKEVEKRVYFLLDFFYKSYFFKSIDGVYSLSDAIWLDKVLFSKTGAPISLGIIFLHISDRLELKITPIIFLAQLILCFNVQGSKFYINPNNGDILNERILDLWVKGTISPFASLNKKDIKTTEHRVIIKKIFDTMKIALMEERKMEEALKVCETLLIFNPNDPYEIRDRGLIFANLDCNHAAISDLKYFVNRCPEDPVSEVIKMQIYSIKRQEIVLH